LTVWVRERLISIAVAVCAFLLPGTQVRGAAQQVTVSGRVELAKTQARSRESDPGNVVVWLTPVAGSPTTRQLANLPRQQVRLRQKNKSFQPHILVATEGADVEFPNADPFFHNVFSLFEGKRFDLGLYEAGSTRTVRFDRPGISYIFCNIHPEMSATILILKTPYYGVSDRQGKLTIPDVPPGNYVLEVWDEGASPENLKNLQRETAVSNQSASLGIIHLTRNSSLHVGHKNKYGRDYDSPTPSNPAYKQPP
jgi:plastocyanin